MREGLAKPDICQDEAVNSAILERPSIYGFFSSRNATSGLLVIIPAALSRRRCLRYCEGSCLRKVIIALK